MTLQQTKSLYVHTASTSPVAAPPPNKNWSEEDLNSALEALRKKEISANKAAKVGKFKISLFLRST